jgi:hypothetical protein
MLSGLGDYVFGGTASRDYDVPENVYTSIIAGKVGVITGKVMYGIIPSEVSVTFIEANNASGTTAANKEFFPDFYDYSLNSYGAVPSNGGQATWMNIPIDGEKEGIIPIWNGTPDGFQSGEIIAGISSMKPLNIGDWMVLPAASNSYLMQNGNGGRGYWYWYGL